MSTTFNASTTDEEYAAALCGYQPLKITVGVQALTYTVGLLVSAVFGGQILPRTRCIPGNVKFIIYVITWSNFCASIVYLARGAALFVSCNVPEAGTGFCPNIILFQSFFASVKLVTAVAIPIDRLFALYTPKEYDSLNVGKSASGFTILYAVIFGIAVFNFSNIDLVYMPFCFVVRKEFIIFLYLGSAIIFIYGAVCLTYIRRGQRRFAEMAKSDETGAGERLVIQRKLMITRACNAAFLFTLFNRFLRIVSLGLARIFAEGNSSSINNVESLFMFSGVNYSIDPLYNILFPAVWIAFYKPFRTRQVTQSSEIQAVTDAVETRDFGLMTEMANGQRTEGTMTTDLMQQPTARNTQQDGSMLTMWTKQMQGMSNNNSAMLQQPRREGGRTTGAVNQGEGQGK